MLTISKIEIIIDPLQMQIQGGFFSSFGPKSRPLQLKHATVTKAQKRAIFFLGLVPSLLPSLISWSGSVTVSPAEVSEISVLAVSFKKFF